MSNYPSGDWTFPGDETPEERSARRRKQYKEWKADEADYGPEDNADWSRDEP
jgi:hypothetical protein